MTKIKDILICLTLLLSVLSCTERFEGNLSTVEKLSTTVSVVVPQIPVAQPQTRAMALKPQIQNLYLAVFDDNGYLLEYIKAEANLATENNTTYTYKASLTPTDFKTTIHFIANAPETIRFGTETEAIGSLFTENREDAYWQRIELPNGIKHDSNGALDAAVQAALTDVRLIRNFAWIQLKTTANNFAIDSYCVINTRNKGSVAPYNTSSGSFAEFAATQTYADLVNEGYNGFIPAEAELDKAIPEESQWYLVNGSDGNYAYFIYEREKPLSDPSFILVKGTYTTETGNQLTDRYYKVDLRDGSGNYFPIIRNFRYGVTITSILHEGHASAEAAVTGAGSGDVSTAIETEDFTNISNNVARLFVSYTDTTLVEASSNVILRYKFVVLGTDGAADQTLNGDNVEVSTATNGDVISSWSKATADATDGWREITIATKELASISKSQDITIKGTVTVNDQTYQLQRKVTLNLRPKYTMQLVCFPDEIINKAGEPFDLIIKVPGGLSQSMFPLEFELEADKLSMTPNLGDDLPVVTGKSIIPNKHKTTIGFIKHLEWTDYDALPNEGGYKSVTCHFKSNKDESETEIWAKNKYFDLATAKLGNYTPHTFSNLSFNLTRLPAEEGQEINFTFTMSQLPEQGYVTVTLGHLEPADDETRLTYIDVVDGKARYSFNPDATTETLRLKTTTSGEGITASVQLSAYHFEDASTSLNTKIIIPKGNIKVGDNENISNNNYRSTTFTLYTADPGKQENPGTDFYAFTALRNGSNSDDIELTYERYQAIMANGGYVYVRFTTTSGSMWNQTTNYFVAKALLSDLMDSNGATLTFEQRQ